MTIVAVNGSGNTPQGVDAPPPSRLMLKEDGAYVFDGTQLAAGAGQDAPSINEIVVTKVTDVSSTLLFGEGDTFDFQPQLTTEPTAPEPYQVKLEDVLVSGYNSGSEAGGGDDQPDLLVGVSGSDTFNFQPQLTTEPTAPEPYMQWKLNNAMVTSYQHSSSGGDLLMNADLLATPGLDVNDSSTNPSNGHSGDGGFADGHNDGGLLLPY